MQFWKTCRWNIGRSPRGFNTSVQKNWWEASVKKLYSQVSKWHVKCNFDIPAQNICHRNAANFSLKVRNTEKVFSQKKMNVSLILLQRFGRNDFWQPRCENFAHKLIFPPVQYRWKIMIFCRKNVIPQNVPLNTWKPALKARQKPSDRRPKYFAGTICENDKEKQLFQKISFASNCSS